MKCAEKGETAGRSSSTTTPIPTSTTRRSSCWPCSKAAIPKRTRDSVERARRWTLAMRSRNGAWAAFDRDNTRELLYRMPFSDFGAMIDPPTEDVTAHVLEMLAALRIGTADPYVARGLEYLRETQRPDGSWFGRWGVNFVYGTWCVISALRALRTGRRDDRARGGLAREGAERRRRLGRKLPFLRRRVVRRRRARARLLRRPGP